MSRFDLFQRIVDGDELALRDAFRTYGASAREIARRIIGPDQADDVVEEVFLLIWTEPERWASPALDVHVLRIARDLSLAVRRRGVTPAMAAHELQPFAILPDQAAPDVVEEINHDELQRVMLRLPDGFARQLEDAWFDAQGSDESSLAEAIETLAASFHSGRMVRRQDGNE